MVALVTVLHLRDPRELAVERLGPERASAPMDDGAMTPLQEIVARVKSASVSEASPATVG